MQQEVAKWSELHPKDCVQVTQQVWLTQRELQFITQLYVPFLGPKATTLYLVLFAELSPQTYRSDVIRLADLLALMNMGIPDFYQARIRLEAVGLLKTYRLENPDAVSTQYTLELQAPASPNLFFKDALLSTMLINQVGHQRFELLQKRFMKLDTNTIGEEVTANFEEGFQLPYNMSQYRRKHQLEKQMLHDVKQQKSFRVDVDLDWQLLTDLLKSQFINEQALTEEIRKMIETLRLYYGLSEREIVHYVIYATDLSTGEIDSEELMKIVIEASQQLGLKATLASDSNEQRVTEEVKTEQAPVVIEQQVSIPKPELSDDMQHLVRLAGEMTPFDFITSIKTQRKGYVTNSEQRLLLDLIQVSQLPSGVINILVHYLLVVKNNPNLTKNLTDAIANDWAQKGIQDAAQAIELVRQREKNRQVNRQSQQAASSKKNYQPPKGRVETVPDWATKPNTTKEKPVDGSSYQNLKQQISQLKTSQE